jgi:hypothetical protein
VVPNACILACAPSDTAADIICDRLAQHMPDKKKVDITPYATTG